jgi:glycosyltransferase involved in cell wall biosynthesis
VSVVIPVYNAQATLARALQSVQAQSLPAHEVICVDDGSTDGSDQLTQAFASDGMHALQWIRADRNRGVAATRNRGLAQATGQFVAFLDADDAWHPDKLRLQVNAMLGQGLDLLGGHSAHCDTDLWESPRLDALSLRDTSLWRALFSNPFHTSSVILRRDPALRFHDSDALSEDYALWLELMAAGWRCARHAEPLSAMFKHPHGEAGLSAELWRMQRGELAALARIGLRTLPAAALLAIPWSCAKFSRRVWLAARRARH